MILLEPMVRETIQMAITYNQYIIQTKIVSQRKTKA